jgi:hypothetical protein
MNCGQTMLAIESFVLVSVLISKVNDVLAILLVSWASITTKDEPGFSHGLLTSK